jgi:D-alanyl-D-alanine carboxypeptidase
MLKQYENFLGGHFKKFRRFMISPGASLTVLISLFGIVFCSIILLAQSMVVRGIFVFGESDSFVAHAFESVAGVPEKKPIEIAIYKDSFATIEIKAQAAYVFDVKTGRVLYEKNKDKVLPLASITKVMTALVATESVNDPAMIIKFTDSARGKTAEENWHLNDLLDYMLVTSSNNAATTIAATIGAQPSFKKDPASQLSSKELFIEKMNNRAKELNMQNTVFYNESGLDIDTSQAGSYSSASDVATLFSYVLKNDPKLLEATRSPYVDIRSTNNDIYHGKNTNTLVGTTPGLIASKTGLTDLAGGNLCIAYDSGLGTPVVIVVLGSTENGRFDDVETLRVASQEVVSQKF